MESRHLLSLGALAVVGLALLLLSEPGWPEQSSGPVRSARRIPGEESVALAPSLESAEQESKAARSTPAPQPAPRAPTRIRVVVRLRDDVQGVGMPEPELLRLDEYGQPWPVTAAQGGHRPPAFRQTSRTFEVNKPGRYVAAWHVWRNVEGTRTWRVCRGRGPEISLSGKERARELVVWVGAADLRVDPTLDAPATSAHTTVTAKDG